MDFIYQALRPHRAGGDLMFCANGRNIVHSVRLHRFEEASSGIAHARQIPLKKAEQQNTHGESCCTVQLVASAVLSKIHEGFACFQFHRAV